MELAYVDTVCAACKSEGKLTVWQALSEGRIAWFETFKCACGHGFEAGDHDTPPPVVRQALIDQIGTFEVWVDDVKFRQAAMKVMTQTLQIKEATAAFRVVRMPARIFVGTKVEAQFVVEALTKAGAKDARTEAHLPK